MIVTVSDINGIKQYSVPGNIKAIFLNIFLVFIVLIIGFFFYIKNLHYKIISLEQSNEVYVLANNKMKNLEKELNQTKLELKKMKGETLSQQINVKTKITQTSLKKEKKQNKVTHHPVIITQKQKTKPIAKQTMDVNPKRIKPSVQIEKLNPTTVTQKQTMDVKPKIIKPLVQVKKHHPIIMTQEQKIEQVKKEKKVQVHTNTIVTTIEKDIPNIPNDNIVITEKSNLNTKPKVVSKVLNTQTQSMKMDSVKQKRLSFLMQQSVGKSYFPQSYGPNTFDDTGLITYIYKKIDVAVPKDLKKQSTLGKLVQRDALKIGDLLFFDMSKDSKGSVNHVGIYAGNNKFVHASSTKNAVVITSLNKAFYSKHYKWARRILN